MDRPSPEDAFAFFGLDPDAELADLKRAYARLLRENRPDDDPEAFMRVQAHFEAARDFLNFAGSLAAEVDASYPSTFVDRPAAHDEVALHLNALFHRDGGPDDAAMLATFRDLARDGGFGDLALEDDLVDHVALKLGLTLRDLHLPRDPMASIRFVRARLEGLLLAGETMTALREFEEADMDSGFSEMDVCFAPDLARALIFRHLEEAKRLEASFIPNELFLMSASVRLYDAVRYSLPQVEKVFGEDEGADEFRRILGLIYTVPGDRLAPLARDFLEQVRRKPARLMVKLDRLKKSTIPTVFAEGLPAPWMIPVEGRLSSRDQRRILSILRGPGERADSRTMFTRYLLRSFVWWVVAAETTYALAKYLDIEMMYVYMAAYGVVLVALNLVGDLVVQAPKKRYRQLIRPRIATAMIEVPCHPQDVAEALVSIRSGGATRRAYRREFEVDPSLCFLSVLALLSRADGPDEEQPEQQD